MDVEGIYALKQFQELCRMHSMTILIHSRSQYSRDLARKLRPEFSKLLITTDVKICIKLITRRNADPSGAGGIDLVIIDFDNNSLRLLEYINKRPLQEETHKQPLIPTILLAQDPLDNATRDVIESIGGSNAIISPPFHTGYILSQIMDILHRRRQLDSTFRDLKQNRVQYPFLPVFTVSKDEIEREAREASAHQGSFVLQEEKDAMCDDWMECESILPPDIYAIRQMERNHREPFPENINGKPASNQDRLGYEMSERLHIDRILSRSAHVALAELHGMRAVETDVDALMDADDLSIDSGDAEDNDAGKVSKQNNASGFTLKALTASDSCDMLLDPSRRPKWAIGGIAADKGGANAISSDLEMRPFIDRVAPNLKVSKTVDGLDRRFVEQCWNTIKGPLALNKTVSKLLTARKVSNRDSDDHGLTSTRATSSSRVSSGKGNTGNSRLQAISEPISEPQRPQTTGSAIDLKPIRLPPPQQVASNKSDKASPHSGRPAEASPNNATARANLRKSVSRLSLVSETSINPNRKISALSLNSTQLEDLANRKDLNREQDATKAIAKLARTTAHDLHFVVMDDSECLHRQLNQGERDLLEEGIRVEKEEDLDRAYIFYSRAGLHSHEPHLSKIYLGNLFFKKRNFMAALKYFSLALDLLETLRGHSESYIQDSFRAFYNRGVTYIVCGDDETGVKDLEKAVSLKPENPQAREILAIALRRIGKFDSAILHTVKRKENLMAAEQEAKNLAIEAATAAAANGNPSHPAPGGGPSMTSSFSGPMGFATIPEDGSLGADKPSPLVKQATMPEPGHPPPGIARQMSTKISQIGAKDAMHKSREQFMEDAENRAIAARTTFVSVTDSRGSLGFRERKEVALKRAFGHGDSGENSSARLSLVAFKMKNGFKPDLFEHLFFKPNSLQEALAFPPGSRLAEHIAAIASTLHLVPLFSSLNDAQITDLATCVEYRPVSSKGQLYIQNSPASGMCVILKGAVDIKIEAEQHTTRNLLVGHLGVYDAVGFIDILFRQEDPKLWAAIVKILKVDASAASLVGILVDVGLDSDSSLLDAGETGTGGTGLGSGFSVLEESIGPSATAESSGVVEAGKAAPNALPARNSGSLSANMVGSASGMGLGGLGAPMLASHHTRAKAPGMFATYYMTTLCELLLIGAKDFARILYQTAADEFLKRLTVLHVCGVFSGLPWLDIVRLARMCQVMTFNSGDIILRQGSKPHYIYFVMDGLCQVWAQANNAEIYERQLNELQEKAKRHDLKYTYHHKLKTSYTRADLPQVKNQKQLATLQQQKQLHTCEMLAEQETDLYMDLQWETNITSAEILRQELGLEIEQVKLKLARAKSLETNNNSKLEQKVWTANDSATQCEVKILRWPMLFGEACVLDPDTGTSRGTVVASTCCHVLVLHKTQIQTFHVNDDLLTNVRLRSVVYPDDKTIEQNLSRSRAWAGFKAKEMSRIRTTRWPKLSSDQEPFIL